MRSPFDSSARSRITWHAIAIVGLLSLPAPGLAGPHHEASSIAIAALDRAIAQAEPDSESEDGAASDPDGDPAPIDETLALQLGDTDPRVLEIQRRLKIGGYYEGEPSEVFDISTDLAVTRFQEAIGLEATGVVDAQTWDRLQKLEVSDAAADPETDSGTDAAAETDSGTDADAAAETDADASPSEPDGAEGDAAPTANDPPRRGGFARLMLWLSISIAAMGIVGTLIYWLLRVLDSGDREPDIDDFDEAATETDADILGDMAGDRDEFDEPIPDALTLVPPSPQPDRQTAAAIAETDATESRNHAAPPTDAADPATQSPQPHAPNPEAPQPQAPQPQAPQPQVLQPQAPPANPAIAADPPPDPAVAMASLPISESPAPAPAPSGELSIAANRANSPLTSIQDIPKLSITESLLQELNHSDPNQRKKAIWELGRRGDSRAIAPLVELMRDSDSQERSLILAVLTEINTRSLQPMQQALALSFRDDSPEVRKNALRDLTRILDSLSQMGYFITQGTFDRDPEVRDTAKWATEQLRQLNASLGLDRLPPDDRDR